MSTFSTLQNEMIFDATAVSNAFICEFMCNAPGDYVKVYLYALMLAHSGVFEGNETDLEDAAAQLSLSLDEVQAALRYWERCRLVDRVEDNPPRWHFLSPTNALLRRNSLPPDEEYEEFGRAIYAIFQDRRDIHGGEVAMAFEWVEQMHLPPEVVLMLIRHMITARGIRFSFKEAQKVAVDMSEQKIHTIEEAEAFFMQAEALNQGCKAILRQLGMRRNPTEPEKRLYEKWTVNWHFTPEAVLKACDETVGGSPSFAYLDKILEGLMKRFGETVCKADGMTEVLEEERTETAAVRDVIRILGIHLPAIDTGVRSAYHAMAAIGGHDLVILAAEQVVAHSQNPTLERVQKLLLSWQDKGMTTPEMVNAYLAALQKQDADIEVLLHIAGQPDGRSSQASRALLTKWQKWQVPVEVLKFAAEQALGREKPLRVMDTLLTEWHEAGITTLEAAKARAATQTAKIPHPGQQNYTQRTYDPNELNGLTAAQMEEMNRLES